MKNVVYGQDHRFVYWAEEIIGIEFRSDYTSIGLEDEQGNIRAAVVFDTFSKCDVCMHVASDGTRAWLNREYIVRCFSYPFLQCGMRRVTGLVPAKNEQALKFDLHLGFEIEGRMKDAMPDDDIVLLGMTRDRGLDLIHKFAKGAYHGR